MASGGARNRSGPQADSSSARSDARGVSYDKLPAEGYKGEVPDFPLSPAVVIFEYFDTDSKQKIRETDEAASGARNDRERDLWDWAWSTPQACAWALEPWRWQAVAMWVRVSALCESPEATAADKGSLHRFADQIGLTPAGLKENGWAIQRSEIDAKRVSKPDLAVVPEEKEKRPQRRLRG